MTVRVAMVVTAQEIRTILREELERHRRLLSGDHWVDGCCVCGAPSHGSATGCPYSMLGMTCTGGLPHVVIVQRDPRGGFTAACAQCQSEMSWQERATNGAI